MKLILTCSIAAFLCAMSGELTAAGENAADDRGNPRTAPSPNRVGLGLQLFEFNEEGARALGLPLDTHGAFVVAVMPGGAGDKAGIKSQDLIVKLDERLVTRPEDAIQALSQGQEGDRVRLTLIRRRRYMVLDAQLTVLNGAGLARQAEPPAGTTFSGGPSLPSANLPRGFVARDDPESSGRLITLKFAHGNPSAQAAFRESLGLVQGYFDAPPKLTLALGDAKDQLIQALFSAKLKGQPVQGLATAVIGDQSGLFALIFDRPAAFRRSYSHLQRMLEGEYPASTAAGPERAVDWNRQTTADGSDAVLLPADWRVTGGAKGTIEAEGPQGESLNFGLALPVSTVSPVSVIPPGTYMSAELRRQIEEAMRTVITSPYLAPVPAQSFAGELVNRVAGGSPPFAEFGRVINTAPAPAPLGGQGLFILRECRLRGRPSVTLAYVATIRTGPQQWMLYTSSVAAPAETFFRSLPTLTRIWGSWKTDDRVFQERLQSAMKSMKETNQIVRDVNDYRTKVEHHAMAVWDHCIRGTDVLENTETGERRIVDSVVVDDMLQKANEQGVPLRKVPIDE